MKDFIKLTDHINNPIYIRKDNICLFKPHWRRAEFEGWLETNTEIHLKTCYHHPISVVEDVKYIVDELEK